MVMKITGRAGTAGHEMAKAIIETIHLMYQNNTALSFLNELILTLQVEKELREEVKKRRKYE